MGSDTQPPSPETVTSNFLKILLEDFLRVCLLLLLMDWFFILGDTTNNFRYLVSPESSEDLASNTSYKTQLLELRRPTCLFRRRVCCPGPGSFTCPLSCLLTLPPIPPPTAPGAFRFPPLSCVPSPACLPAVPTCAPCGNQEAGRAPSPGSHFLRGMGSPTVLLHESVSCFSLDLFLSGHSIPLGMN